METKCVSMAPLFPARQRDWWSSRSREGQHSSATGTLVYLNAGKILAPGFGWVEEGQEVE